MCSPPRLFCSRLKWSSCTIDSESHYVSQAVLGCLPETFLSSGSIRLSGERSQHRYCRFMGLCPPFIPQPHNLTTLSLQPDLPHIPRRFSATFLSRSFHSSFYTFSLSSLFVYTGTSLWAMTQLIPKRSVHLHMAVICREMKSRHNIIEPDLVRLPCGLLSSHDSTSRREDLHVRHRKLGSARRNAKLH